MRGPLIVACLVAMLCAPALCAPRVARAWAGDALGLPQGIFHTVETAVYFYAAIEDEQPGHKPLLWLIVLDAAEREVARLGGPGWPADNGLPLDSLAPGRYRVRVFLDGRPQPGFDFEVARLVERGQVRFVEAHLEDASGKRRNVFNTEDHGVYARISLVNKSKERWHEHLVQVRFESAGAGLGRVLGGVLSVPLGARLDGLDLPAEVDEAGHNGIAIRAAGLLPGNYAATVWLDGAAVKRLTFKIIPKAAPPGPRTSPPATPPVQR
jgi:hypothetical protein